MWSEKHQHLSCVRLMALTKSPKNSTDKNTFSHFTARVKSPKYRGAAEKETCMNVFKPDLHHLLYLKAICHHHYRQLNINTLMIITIIMTFISINTPAITFFLNIIKWLVGNHHWIMEKTICSLTWFDLVEKLLLFWTIWAETKFLSWKNPS